jgi:hypothetical protein
MRYRAAAAPLGGLGFFLCTALVMVVCLWLFAVPAVAQEGPPAGTPAQGTNPDSPSSPPDLVTIAATGCTVSEGASITLEDPDGTQAQFVDGQLGIEITSTSEQITIVGPNDDYIGDHAVSSSDPGFDTAGDYAVVTTTGIACQGAALPPTKQRLLRRQRRRRPPRRRAQQTQNCNCNRLRGCQERARSKAVPTLWRSPPSAVARRSGPRPSKFLPT